jgi:hypothetical protein
MSTSDDEDGGKKKRKKKAVRSTNPELDMDLMGPVRTVGLRVTEQLYMCMIVYMYGCADVCVCVAHTPARGKRGE